MIATSKNIKPITPTDKISKKIFDAFNPDMSDREICSECGTRLRTHVEQRDNGYSETIVECEGCG